MTPLNYFQLHKWIAYLQPLMMGALLQEIQSYESFLVFKFYNSYPFFLVISLKPNQPFLFLRDSTIGIKNKKKRPIELFLKAHFINKKIVVFEIDPSGERIVRIDMGQGSQLELTLIPGYFNIKATCLEKSIYLVKPRELPKNESSEFSINKLNSLDLAENTQLSELPTAEQMEAGFNSLCKPAKDKQNSKPNLIDIKKQNEKLNLLLVTLNQEIEQKSEEKIQIQKLLEDLFLKGALTGAQGTQKDQYYLDLKKLDVKQEGIQKRISEIKVQILNNQSLLSQGVEFKEVTKTAHPALIQSKAKGRSYQIEDCFMSYGHSAKDNMALLRKAKAWDMWLHLKDEPSSHLFISCPKNKVINEKILFAAAKWFVDSQIKSNKLENRDKFAFIVTQVKYVSPIKGDKIGRVTYKNERELVLRRDK